MVQPAVREVTIDLTETIDPVAQEIVEKVQAKIEPPAPLVRAEPAPLNIVEPRVEEPSKVRGTPAPKMRTPLPPRVGLAAYAPANDSYDISLPEARRPRPPPLRLRRRPAKERRASRIHGDVVIFDAEFVARAFKIFSVLTLALALLAIDLRFGRALDVPAEILSFLRMMGHIAIGAGVVLLLRPSEPASK